MLLWNVAQRFPTWGNVWKAQLSSHKDLALLSSIFGFSQLARKQHLNYLLYLVASAPVQLHTANQKGWRRRQLVNSLLEFLFLSNIWVRIWWNLSASHLLVAEQLVASLPMVLCVCGLYSSSPCRLCVCKLCATSQPTPFGLEFYRTIMKTERFPPLIPFFVCELARCLGRHNPAKEIGWNLGLRRKGGFVRRCEYVEGGRKGSLPTFLIVSLWVWYRYFPIIKQ